MRSRPTITLALCFLLSAPLAAVAHARSTPAIRTPAALSAAAIIIYQQPSEDRLHALEQAVSDARSAGDNAWMLVSSAFVLMMTGPGLALFYGGLVRKKNVLATMMQSFALMAVITIVWAVVGYSLCFAPGNHFIGGLSYAFLHGSQPFQHQLRRHNPAANLHGLSINVRDHHATPDRQHVAERMKFSAMLIFTTLWFFLVYAPMAHMVWGAGGLLNSSGGTFPTLDFHGGTVVHITSGVSALICALYLGRRRLSEATDAAA